MWEKIFEVLEENGIDVYPPYQKVGECFKPYVVVKQDGSVQVQDFSSEFIFYQFLLYLPYNEYHKIDKYEKKVRAVVGSKLFPDLMAYGGCMPDYYDDDVHGYMRSFLYRASKRNKFL